MRYAAFVHKNSGSIYGASFPDFPGCVAAEESLEALMTSAAQALSLHVRSMLADDEPIPEPTDVDAVMQDPKWAEDRVEATLVLIPLVRDLGSTTRVNVSLDLGLLQAIDSEARQRKQTRSAFIASAVRKELIE